MNKKIDKEVKRLLFPLNFMQILVFNPKYYVKNNFINPNNCFNKIILLCGAGIFVTSYIYRIMEIWLDENFRRYSSINYLMFASYFDFGIRCLGFIKNCFFNFTQTKNNILFVLHFQEVHRFLSDGPSLKRFIIRSWMSIVAIFGFYIIMALYLYFMFINPPWNVIFDFFVVVSLDTNIIYAMRLMSLLTDKVVLWNIQLLLARKWMLSARYCKNISGLYPNIKVLQDC